ncbi:hypothetical protein [Acidisphaera sp. S103]|uniref:hypothetical protein n=1 Tax=Acidisphaera sp. S103 TaxID=1747223 RepID=UPI00131CA70E|nr:hypothetical protein [Acidisphaera sp. S103]
MIALWIAKNNPGAFSPLDRHAQRIVLAMLDTQAGQKLGRRPKFLGVITSNQAALLWRIQDAKPSDQNTLLRHTCEFGLDLVTHGFVSILPDDELDGWELVLSPEGEMLAQQLRS